MILLKKRDKIFVIIYNVMDQKLLGIEKLTKKYTKKQTVDQTKMKKKIKKEWI